VSNGRRPILVGFAVLVIVSGILCLLLDEHWFEFAPSKKVPLYAIVGGCVCFAFSFALLDLFNLGLMWARGTKSTPLIESPAQVNLILVTTMLMGAAFGLIFGLRDVEDQRGLALRDALIQEEKHCVPIGATLGGGAGIVNYLLMASNASRHRFSDTFAHSKFSMHEI
jgi:hypothetical protein